MPLPKVTFPLSYSSVVLARNGEFKVGRPERGQDLQQMRLWQHVAVPSGIALPGKSWAFICFPGLFSAVIYGSHKAGDTLCLLLLHWMG